MPRCPGPSVAILRLAATGLHQIHTVVGLLEQLGLRITVFGIKRGAYAQADIETVLGDLHRLLEGRADLVDDVAGIFCLGDAFQQHHELIATQPRHGIGVANAVREAIGHCAQQLVAAAVAVGIVDLLEAIQIHVEQGDASAIAPHPR